MTWLHNLSESWTSFGNHPDKFKVKLSWVKLSFTVHQQEQSFGAEKKDEKLLGKVGKKLVQVKSVRLIAEMYGHLSLLLASYELTCPIALPLSMLSSYCDR